MAKDVSEPSRRPTVRKSTWGERGKAMTRIRAAYGVVCATSPMGKRRLQTYHDGARRLHFSVIYKPDCVRAKTNKTTGHMKDC